MSKWLGFVLVLWYMSFASADTKARKRIRERSSGYCEICGISIRNDNMVVAHISHARGKNYNAPENLRGSCKHCEALYHIGHVFCPGQIGMRRDGNDATAYGYYSNANDMEKRDLQERFPTEVQWLLHRFE